MMSFEIPVDRWRAIERRLRQTLDEIEDHRARFPDVEARLLDAVRSVQQSPLGLALKVETAKRATAQIPVPQAEALVYARRHALGHSPDTYYEMRRRVGEGYVAMTLSTELIREMHCHVVGVGRPEAGEWKRRPNYFPVYDAQGNWIASQLKTPPEDVPEFMERLNERYHALRGSNSIDPLLLAAAYTLDLFCIHPFQDANGRVTRLALQLMLHQAGHHVGRYISFDGLLGQKRRTGYTGSIMQSEFGWRTAEHDPTPWCKFLTDSVLRAYREFERRTDALVESSHHITMLSSAIAEMPPHFCTADLTKRLPDVPETIAIMLLNRMRRQGALGVVLNNNVVEWQKRESDGREALRSRHD